MQNTFSIKPTQKPIQDYYATLKQLRALGVTDEMSIRPAFQNLLADCAKMLRWTLIPEYKSKAKGRLIRPDGTVKDRNSLPRGYWEAKDEKDKLNEEIALKRQSGYPFKNTIFEDSRKAVLFQDGFEVMRITLSNKNELVRFLEAFFNYSAPNFEEFEMAVEMFKSLIPELAKVLAQKVKEAHRSKIEFKEAFASLLALCQSSLNKEIRIDAVDEMLIQHILTERIISTVFDNQDFMTKNVIAVEIQKTVETLTGVQFDRIEFLRTLDPFYLAIERAAQDIHYYNDKLYLMNHVYERFFQGYCVKSADTHGIVYTPQEVVNFMCTSIEEALISEFSKSLGDEDVQLLDPATGTGSFLVSILHRASIANFDQLYTQQLYANEVLLMPYYIASLNIEHTYYEQMGKYKAFEGLCFVDTLDLDMQAPTGRNGRLRFTEANTERIKKQVNAPITVVFGNPPYNAHQLNENDNNKNRKYRILDGHLRDTYVHDSHATNKNTLYDPFVRFFRWATDRLEGRDGIVCFITNNNFVHDITFDGVRKHLAKDFNDIFHLDLGGNYRKGESGDNIFGIKPGVGITLAIRNSTKPGSRIFYYRIPKMARKEDKLQRIAALGSFEKVEWEVIQPDKNHTWLPADNGELFESLIPLGRADVRQASMTDAQVLFLNYSNGVKTNRDQSVYDFDRDRLEEKVRATINDYNAVLDKYKRVKSVKKSDAKFIDDFCEKEGHIEWSESLKKALKEGVSADFDATCIRLSLYRPFTKKWLYFNELFVERRYQFPNIFPKSESDNLAIGQIAYGRKWSSCLISNCLPDLNFFGDPAFWYPAYVYQGSKAKRTDNISATSQLAFKEHYKDTQISKVDIVHYIYALLHHPLYRKTFSDNLKLSMPRIPFAPDFWTFSKAGRELVKWHLNYETIEPFKLKWITDPNIKPNWRIERMKLVEGGIIVNEWLSLNGVPPEAKQYLLGGRSALEWVIDQYRVKTRVNEDKSEEIVSDPNRPDEPEYIIRLVERVVRVSVETMKIVNALPEKWME